MTERKTLSKPAPQRGTSPHAEGRRWFFAGWIGMSIVLAGFVAALGMLKPLFGAQTAIVGTAVPFFMILTLAVGLGCLIWLVRARPSASHTAGR